MDERWKLRVAFSALLGLGQFAYLSIVLSIFVFSPDTKVYVLFIGEILILGTFLLWTWSSQGAEGWIRRSLSGPSKRWRLPPVSQLYLHAIFCWLGFANSYTLLFAALFGSLQKFPDPVWGFLAGSGAIAFIFYSRFALNVLGQGYEDNRGASLTLAARVSTLASRMLVLEKRAGLDVLRKALAMAGKIFYYRQHQP